jgi:hypothetical protein
MSSPRVLNLPKAPGPEAVRESMRRYAYGAFTTARLLRAAPTDELRGFERVLVPTWLVCLDVVSVTRGRRGRPDEASARVFVDCLSHECRALPDGTTVEDNDDVAATVETATDLVAEADAKSLAHKALRWQLLRSGGINLRDLEMSASRAEEVYVPVWLGYYSGDRGRVRVRCLNGVDGTPESASYAMKVLRMLQEPVSTGQSPA